jgi:hypothetical protein
MGLVIGLCWERQLDRYGQLDRSWSTLNFMESHA